MTPAQWRAAAAANTGNATYNDDFRPGRATRTRLTAHRASSHDAGALSPAGSDPAAAASHRPGGSAPVAAAGLMPAAPRWEDGPPPEVGTGVPRLDFPRLAPLRAGGDPVPVRPRPATPQARPIETDSYLGRRRASAYRSRHAGAVGRRRWAGLLVVLGLLGMMPLPVCAWLGVPLTPAATMAALGSLLTGAVLVLLAAPPRFVPEAMESRPGGESR